LGVVAAIGKSHAPIRQHDFLDAGSLAGEAQPRRSARPNELTRSHVGVLAVGQRVRRDDGRIPLGLLLRTDEPISRNGASDRADDDETECDAGPATGPIARETAAGRHRRRIDEQLVDVAGRRRGMRSRGRVVLVVHALRL